MKITNKRLKELLVDAGFIDEVDFNRAQSEAINQEVDLIDVVLKLGLMNEQNLGKLLADEFSYRYVYLKNTELDEKIVRLIPEQVAAKQLVLAFGRKTPGILQVAMNDPENLEFVRFLEKKIGEEVEVYFATKNDLIDAMSIYKVDLNGKLQNIVKKAKDTSLGEEEKEQSVVEIVDTILRYAHQNNASDVHIEPQEKNLLVRFRLDGVLRDIVRIDKEFQDPIVTRIKIMSKLRTDEHRAAQDGKIRFKTETEQVDIRVSIIPIIYGEKIVMRLLSEKGKYYSIKELGFSDDDFKKVNLAVKRPHGMILVTGPTGSGKTTTLYAMLKELNRREVNIATIEDPIEYDMPGINQIQVNTKTNLTFAKGLRSLVRQDPDIILVGEIRDEETAGISVNAAMTGHLVLSSLHTNDAATSLPRLIDMGVEPFLIASTVNLIVAQRLVRKICSNCIMSDKISKEEIELIESNPTVYDLYKKVTKKKLKTLDVFKGKGCHVCNNSGYHGRMGIFEVLEIDEEVRRLITAKATAEEIRNSAIKRGKMTTVLEDGFRKVLNGLTSIEEILRVAID